MFVSQAALLQTAHAAIGPRFRATRPLLPIRTYRGRRTSSRPPPPSLLEAAVSAYNAVSGTYTTVVWVGGVIGTAVVAYSVYANYQAFVAKLKVMRQNAVDRISATRSSVINKANSTRTSVSSQMDSMRGSVNEKVESAAERAGSMRDAIQEKGASLVARVSTEREPESREGPSTPEQEVQQQSSSSGPADLWRARFRRTSQKESADKSSGSDSS